MSNITKNGVTSTECFYENGGYNLVDESIRNKVLSYVPAKDTENSYAALGPVNFEECVPGERLHISADIEFSGFDASSTAGQFQIRFQGSKYSVAQQAFVWTGAGSGMTNMNNGSAYITSIVQDVTQGTHHFEYSFNLGSDFPEIQSKQNIGFRTDYSNGVGKITLKNVVVTKEKYYAEKQAKVGSDFILGDNLYEY